MIGTSKELDLPAGTTLADLIALERLDVSREHGLYVNGRGVQASCLLWDGDHVVYATPVRGEKTVKLNNEVWRKHANDQDQWPSGNHAHNQDAREVLDLDTGQIYDARTRKPTRRLKEKVLTRLSEELDSGRIKLKRKK